MIGAIVGILEIALPGLGFSIGATAFVATMVIFLVASVLYLSGAIRVTNKLRKFMFTAIIISQLNLTNNDKQKRVE